jgi:hypothetical protein
MHTDNPIKIKSILLTKTRFSSFLFYQQKHQKLNALQLSLIEFHVKINPT